MTDQPIHEEQYKECTFKIFIDEDAQSPREGEDLGTMVCWHSRYTLSRNPSKGGSTGKACTDETDQKGEKPQEGIKCIELNAQIVTTFFIQTIVL